MNRACVAAALVWLTACTGRGVLVYPPAPADPADTWPAGMTGPDCSETSPLLCRDLKIGSGEPVRPFAQVTVRVTIEDTEPAATHGPMMLTFVYPSIDKIPFRGRDRDLTATIFAEGMDDAAFFARSEAAMLGASVIGMRMGGVRRLTERYAGRLGRLELPSGQLRHFTLELAQVCYPELWVGTRPYAALLDGGSPVRLIPRVTIKGCGHP